MLTLPMLESAVGRSDLSEWEIFTPLMRNGLAYKLIFRTKVGGPVYIVENYHYFAYRLVPAPPSYWEKTIRAYRKYPYKFLGNVESYLQSGINPVERSPDIDVVTAFLMLYWRGDKFHFPDSSFISNRSEFRYELYVKFDTQGPSAVFLRRKCPRARCFIVYRNRIEMLPLRKWKANLSALQPVTSLFGLWAQPGTVIAELVSRVAPEEVSAMQKIPNRPKS